MDVRAIARNTAPGLPGFDKLLRYQLARSVRPDQHHYLRQMEASTLHGQAVARVMLKLRQSGFTPDAILAHPGWGEALFAKDIFPNAKLVNLCEWYYSAAGADLGFDPEFPISFDDAARIRMWNAQHSLDLIQCDVAVSPTSWQRSRYPNILQPKIVVHHEGIATDSLGPNPHAMITTPSGLTLKSGDPVITYVARNLEPYRGFHVFMRALQKIQKANPRCHALIVGGDEVSYGKRPTDAANWREKMLAEVKLDPTRTHFLGRIPKEQFVRVLQLSAAHVYLTYPFVLSWSLLEAMACGTPIIASDTAPVREVIRNDENGSLVNFFDSQAIANKVLDTLGARNSQTPLRRQAQADAQHYNRNCGLLAYEKLLGINSRPTTQHPQIAQPNLHERDDLGTPNVEEAFAIKAELLPITRCDAITAADKTVVADAPNDQKRWANLPAGLMSKRATLAVEGKRTHLTSPAIATTEITTGSNRDKDVLRGAAQQAASEKL